MTAAGTGNEQDNFVSNITACTQLLVFHAELILGDNSNCQCICLLTVLSTQPHVHAPPSTEDDETFPCNCLLKEEQLASGPFPSIQAF